MCGYLSLPSPNFQFGLEISNLVLHLVPRLVPSDLPRRKEEATFARGTLRPRYRGNWSDWQAPGFYMVFENFLLVA